MELEFHVPCVLRLLKFCLETPLELDRGGRQTGHTSGGRRTDRFQLPRSARVTGTRNGTRTRKLYVGTVVHSSVLRHG